MWFDEGDSTDSYVRRERDCKPIAMAVITQTEVAVCILLMDGEGQVTVTTTPPHSISGDFPEDSFIVMTKLIFHSMMSGAAFTIN